MSISNEAFEELRCQFQTADLKNKLNIARDAALLHDRFQHYVSLEMMLKMIKQKEMWLTRSDSLTLDDWNECKKFGVEQQHQRTYIGCFSHHPCESAAMWGLYGSRDANQVKFSIPCDVMSGWIKYLKELNGGILAAECMHGSIVSGVRPLGKCTVDFTDVLYASVKGCRIGEKIVMAESVGWGLSLKTNFLR